MKKSSLVILALLFLVHCEEPKPPEQVIDEQTYEKMFIEFAIIDQMDEKLRGDKSREELRQMIFDAYSVSEQEFEISHRYYEDQLDAQIERSEEINLQLRAERDTLVVIERLYEKAKEAGELDSLRQSLSDK